MDSYLMKELFKQDLQDLSGFYFFYFQFPEETGNTQSACGGI
jgi:hypothetical protein